MNLIERQTDNIDYNAQRLMSLVHGYATYPFNHGFEHREMHVSMYRKYQQRMDEALELVWVLTKAEKEGVTI